MLLVDGHKAHVTQEVIEAATRNRGSIFSLPAHSSHLLQPLDLSLFGPLKRGWVKACAAFSHLTSTVVNQRNFAKIFNVAWHSSTTPEVIRGGFKRAGIFPYDPSMFDFEKLVPIIRQIIESVSSTSGITVLVFSLLKILQQVKFLQLARLQGREKLPRQRMLFHQARMF